MRHIYNIHACRLSHSLPIPLAKLQKVPVTPALLSLESLCKVSLQTSTGHEPGQTKKLQTIAFVKVEPSTTPSVPVRHSSRFQSVKDIISTMPSYLRDTRSSGSYSFPPSIDSIDSFDFGSPQKTYLPDIDEEPFAHFISPVQEDDDPFDPLSLSAGIIVSEGPRTSKASKFRSNVADKWTRYVKVNHTQLHSRYHASIPEEDEDEEETFMSLEDHRLNDTPQMVTQLTTPPRTAIIEPTRGRAQELLSRKTNRARRRYSRTLSGHRHSWREPSPDLFTVDESEEDDLPVLRRTKTKKAKDGADRRRSSKSRVRGEVSEKSRL